MNVLSLFDGMSCGRIALDRAGITVKNYYASEIDKYAQIVSAANYPDIIRLGDVTKIKASDLPQIDLLIGGSPCQGFSFAGKQLNFDDPRSALFFEFVRLVKECKPKYFFLENVVMKKEYQAVISECLGVEPVKINSALVSAQNRNRLYWTNIPFEGMPADRGIVLRDIIEDAETDKEKAYCIDANYFKGASHEQYEKKKRRQLVVCGASRGRNIVDGKRKDEKGVKCKQRIEVRKDEKTNTLTSVQKDNLILAGYAEGINGHDIIKRVYSVDGKSPTATAICGGNQEIKIETPGLTWRKLTPIECERLQTVPDNYTAHVSNSQRYKMLGNGWTVDVIAWFFEFMKSGKVRGKETLL